MRGPVTYCLACRERKHLAAFGLCERCYQQQRRKRMLPKPSSRQIAAFELKRYFAGEAKIGA